MWEVEGAAVFVFPICTKFQFYAVRSCCPTDACGGLYFVHGPTERSYKKDQCVSSNSYERHATSCRLPDYH